MKRITLFLLIAAVAISSAEAQKVKRTKKTEDDGFKWYLLEQGKYKGVEIEKGTAVIPLYNNYTDISYIPGKHFLVTKEGVGQGVYDKSGSIVVPLRDTVKVIMPKSKGPYWYEKILYSVTDPETGKTIVYTHDRRKMKFDKEYKSFHQRDGYLMVQGADRKWGVCDLNGKEILPPMEFDENRIRIQSDGFIVGDYIFGKAFYDLEGNMVIPENRGYNKIEVASRYIEVYKGYPEDGLYSSLREKNTRMGICDKYGKEIIKVDIPAWGRYIHYSEKEGFYYSLADEGHKYKHYLGVTLDAEGHGIPNPDYPLGSSNIPDQEETAYNNSTSTYQPANNYNTYTPPAQQKQQSSGSTGGKSSSTSNKNSSTTQPKSTPKSSAGASSNKPSTTRTTKERTHPFENYNKPVKCANCRGTGMARCFGCDGKGYIRKSGIDKNGKQVFRNERHIYCNGTGKIKCTVCNGKGTR